MRNNARPRFLAADAGMTGGNFAVAETGTFVVCTNEGNADIGAAVPPLHIASIGIEKLIPRAEDMGVFLHLLSRSAEGRRSLSIPPISRDRGKAGNCTSYLWTTAEAAGLACRTSGIP